MSSGGIQNSGTISNQVLQIGINNFFRLSFAVYSIFLGCILFPFAILTVWYFGQNFVESTKEIKTAIQDDLSGPTAAIVICLSTVFAILGTLQFSSSKSCGKRIANGYLLPISTWKYLLISDLIDFILLTTSIVLGLLPAMLVGFNFYLYDSLPLFFALASIGSGIIRCREDVRYWIYFAMVCFGLYLFFERSFITTAELLPRRRTVLIQMICGLIVFSNLAITLLILDSHRKGKVISGQWILNYIYANLRNIVNSQRQNRRSGLFEFSSPIAALVWYDWVRTIWRSIPWIFGLNAIGFAYSSPYSTRFFATGWCLLFSIVIVAVSAFRVCLRSNQVLNQLPSHQSTLPVSDRMLGYVWLGNFAGILLAGLLLVGLSLVPVYLNSVTNGVLTDSLLNLIPVVISFLIILLNVFTVLISGRPYLIVSSFFLVAFAVFSTGYNVAAQNFVLLNLQMYAFNTIVLLAYVALTYTSIKMGLFSWVAQLIMFALIAYQVINGRVLSLNLAIDQTELYGTLLLPGFPLVAAPLAVYCNRHR